MTILTDWAQIKKVDLLELNNWTGRFKTFRMGFLFSFHFAVRDDFGLRFHKNLAKDAGLWAWIQEEG